ncbi:MAG: PHP domain-containing protein [Deltaproteobacteria bacterium]|nr:PHP domain-containing protein [Deltaproteobacteria bacterium]
MLKYSRNKLISVVREDHDTLSVHGILDDDIYSLELNITVRISDLQIIAINGKWNRWTTPECHRAENLLNEAVGFRVEKGFTGKIHKVIGRKACRHFANLLIECCFSAKEAALIADMDDNAGRKQEKAVDESVKSVIAAGPDISSKGFIIDLHVHTSPASPCSSADVNLLIEEAKRIGLDGICLTDHNFVWEPAEVEELRQRHDFLVLAGNEITTDQGDMLVFGLSRDIKGIIRLKDLRDEVDRAGGFLIAAHPFRGFLTFGIGELGLSAEKAMQRPLFKYVDALEVMNGKVTEKENLFAAEVAHGLGLPATGGSDAHEVSETGLYATRFLEKIKGERDLITALKSGKYMSVEYRK